MIFLTALLVVGACSDAEPQRDAAAECDEAAALSVAERFGERMRSVSLLAPDSIASAELAEAYGDLVTDELLAEWQSDPAKAPGRSVSNPWPARLEVGTVAAASEGCRIEGAVIHVTAADTMTAVSRDSVSLLIIANDGWRISAYSRAAITSGAPQPGDSSPRMNDVGDGGALEPPGDSTGAAAAVAVVREYYAMIDAGELKRAYALWSDDGAASGQTFEQFSRGFASTDRVTVATGEPGRIEGAAGSRYIEIPVRLEAVSNAGTVERYAGTFTLRRSVVDGATPVQRRWRISSAEMRAVRP